MTVVASVLLAAARGVDGEGERAVISGVPVTVSDTRYALLAVGGVCYTAGVPFYIAKNVRYLHSVFHLWVLAGSIFQFMAVILFVI